MVGIETDEKRLELLSLLEEFLGEPRKHYESKGQISFDCPNCSNEKGVDYDGKGNLEINYELGVYNCWSCAETHETKGKIYRLFKDHANKDIYVRFIKGRFEFDSEYYEHDAERLDVPGLVLPDEYFALTGKQKHILFSDAFSYLYSRNITDEMMETYKMGFCLDGKYKNRIVLPSYDKDGNLNYFVARSIFKSSKYKYLNPDTDKTQIIFNEKLIDWAKPVFLVEGGFDHIVIPNSIPMLGKKMYEKLFATLYEKAQSWIIIILDADANEDAKKVFNKLDGGRLRNKILLNKMPGDHDPSSFNEHYGQEHLKAWLREHNVKLKD